MPACRCCCIPLGLAVLSALALFIHGEVPASLALPALGGDAQCSRASLGYLLIFLLLTGDTALHRRYPKIPSLPWRVRLELVGASFIEWLAAAATFACCVAAHRRARRSRRRARGVLARRRREPGQLHSGRTRRV